MATRSGRVDSAYASGEFLRADKQRPYSEEEPDNKRGLSSAAVNSSGAVHQGERQKGAVPDESLAEGQSEPGSDLITHLEASLSKNKKSHPKWSIDRFELGRPLGSGAFGKVYLARTKKEHFIVALKILVKSKLEDGQTEHLVKREIDINMHIKHPNIVAMYGYFWDDHNITLIMEYAPNGMLYRQLMDKGRFSERESATYIAELTEALIYLHGLKIIHRDIKPENLMLGGMGELKLADFGWAIQTSEKRRTKCGTAEYLPPEMATPNQVYDASVDIWCTGVLLFEFLVGVSPFIQHGTSRQRITLMEVKIRNIEYTIPEHVSPGPAKLIREMLKFDGNERLPLTKLKKDPWILKTKLRRTEIDLFVLEAQADKENKRRSS